MPGKLRVAILFGGESGEHDVSLVSAASVINNISKDKYELYLVGIDKKGKWYHYSGDTKRISNGNWINYSKPIVFPPDPSFKGFFELDNPNNIITIDVVFPVMHGPHAEDGTIQGVLELAGIPYVGCGVAASATGMDKEISKKLFSYHKLNQVEFSAFNIQNFINDKENIVKDIESRLGYPCFIKPANMGSSVGISKASNKDELIKGVENAAKYDNKIVVEIFIKGREIECSVLGNDDPLVSQPGEIVPCNEFYDYEAKYNDHGKSGLLIPADLTIDMTKRMQSMAIEAFKTLGCSGLSRVDFFVTEDNEIFINEVNTMPGFTSISMYPKLWEASGVSYNQLIDRLISLAINKYNAKRR